MMTPNELAELFERLPRKPRYVNDAPKTIRDLTRIVVDDCEGDAFNLWKGKPAAEVNHTLMSLHGVGPGIASMGVLLIEKAFGVLFSDLDRRRMDIKPDVHTVRVLYRLGVSEANTTAAAIATTRRMNPSFPGELDNPVWVIGRKWCRAFDPICHECPMNEVCLKRI
jgi:endonuclease III